MEPTCALNGLPMNLYAVIVMSAAQTGLLGRLTTSSHFPKVDLMMIQTFAAYVEAVMQRGPEWNFSWSEKDSSMSAIRNPTPWTWHPHMPGVTTSWLAAANGVTVRTINRWRKRASPADVNLSMLSAEIGLAMSLLRPAGYVMPLWSRMAIADYASKGASYVELAVMFRCGKSTVWRCVKRWPEGFAPLSGKRVLTKQQQSRTVC